MQVFRATIIIEYRYRIYDGLNCKMKVLSLRGLDICGQAIKSIWGMSWHQKAKKGVEVCDNLGVVDKRAMIPRSLNEHTLNT